MKPVLLDIIILWINNALQRLVEQLGCQYTGISYLVLMNAGVGRQYNNTPGVDLMTMCKDLIRNKYKNCESAVPKAWFEVKTCLYHAPLAI